MNSVILTQDEKNILELIKSVHPLKFTHREIIRVYQNNSRLRSIHVSKAGKTIRKLIKLNFIKKITNPQELWGSTYSLVDQSKETTQ